MINTTSQKDMFKQILLLSTPIIIENILQTLLGTVDAYFAGQIGDAAIAAITLTNLVINIYLAFFLAISMGTSVVMARVTGEHDEEHARAIPGHSLVLATGIGLIISAGSYILRNLILSLLNPTADIMVHASPYFTIIASSAVLIAITNVLSACFRAQKDTKTPMYSAVISNVMNVIFNAIFMEMGLGIVGIAYATVLSRAVVMAYLLIILMKRTKGIFKVLKKGNWDKDIARAVLGIGIPSGIERLIQRIGLLAYGTVVLNLGTSYYTASNLGALIEGYMIIPITGFATATTVLMGFSLGEHNVSQAKKFTWYTSIISACVAFGISVVVYIFATPLVSLFSDTPIVIESAAAVLKRLTLLQPLSAVAQIMTAALQGAGDTKFPLFASTIGTWLIRICIGYVLSISMGMSLFGFWVAYLFDVGFRLTVTLLRFRREGWAKIEIAL